MPATVPVVQPCAAFNTSSCTSGNNCAYSHGPDSFSLSTGGRNVCLAFLAKLHCAGCNYSHERHDVSTLDDEELEPIVQQKLQEIQFWITRTQQWSLSPAPESPAPFAFAPPHGYNQQQLPYSGKKRGYAKHNTPSFANTDPSKVVEFKPKGLQLPTPTSPKSQESLSNAPNEDPAGSLVESAQDNAAFEATAGWEIPSNGDGWFTPESNPGTNTEDKKLDECTEGKESKEKFDWAEDADQNLPITPLNWTDTPATVKGKGKAVTEEAPESTAQCDGEPSGGWGASWDNPKVTDEIEASNERPVEITKDMEDAWTAEYGLGGWSAGTDANGWDDAPKVAEPTGDHHWDTPPGSDTWRTGGANKNDWDTVPSKGKKAKWAVKEKSRKSPPLTPKPKNKDTGFHKGPTERDQKTWGNGWKEQGVIRGTTPWESSKKGKTGGKPPPKLPAAKPSVITNFGSTKEKGQQASGSKDAFTFNRITPTTATPQSTRVDQEDILQPDPDKLPELPSELEDEDLSPEMKMILRQAVVPKGKIPSRPSVAPPPESTQSDKGTSWVNGTLEPGWNMDSLKVSSKCKDVQMNEGNGWNHIGRSNSKASSSTAIDWPKLGK